MEANTGQEKLNFLYSIPLGHGWNDGLRAAIDLLDADFDITRYNVGEPWQHESHGHSKYFSNWDSFLITGIGYTSKRILCWGSPNASWIQKIFKERKSTTDIYLCFGGGPVDHPLLHEFTHVFVEDAWTLERMRKKGIPCSLAFGTNTQLFRPMRTVKRWREIYPAAFARWKRHDIFVKHATQYEALAVGYMQPNGHEAECYQICKRHNIDVLPYVSPDVMAYLYNMSDEVLVTADIYGGGQRTILEALACKIPVRKKLLNERLLTVYDRGLLTEQDYYKAIKKVVC